MEHSHFHKLIMFTTVQLATKGNTAVDILSINPATDPHVLLNLHVQVFSAALARGLRCACQCQTASALGCWPPSYYVAQQ